MESSTKREFTVDQGFIGKIAEDGGAVNKFAAFLEAGAIKLVEIDS